jgi:hypothetical protein
MSTTSKSPRTVALVALRAARDALPPYAHRFSPKKFTQPQLFACLVLKTFFKTDYRGIVAMLDDLPELRRVIGLQNVPHFTTLQKAARRMLLSMPAQRLLTTTIQMAKPSGRVELAAVDSSGLESHHVSRYFVRRRSREPGLWQTTTYTCFPKLGVVCDCSNHMILSTLMTRGPTPDVHQLERTLRSVPQRVTLKTLLADAGYESESNHVFCREHLGVESIIPTTERGRPRKDGKPKPVHGHYRRQMKNHFPKAAYGQRWQVETVFSMIKRNLGSALKSRTYWAQCRELMLLALVHNIMILLPIRELFYRAG